MSLREHMEPTPAESPSPKRSRAKRHLGRASLVLGAVLLLIVLPGFVASQPRFFSHFTGTQQQYEAWSTSTHVEARCESCHVSPRPLDRGLYRVRMVGQFYLSLFASSRVPSVFATPTNASCLVCHSDLRTVSPKGDLQIPHRAHVTILKMECVECHDNLVHTTSPEGSHTPRMAECFRCHDGDKAEDACTACHTEKAAPATHATEDWLVLHAEKANDPACVSCHKWTENWCVDCHQHRPRSHVPDWRATHGARVEQHRSCEACHETSFCATCHGEVPQLNFDPTLALVK